MQFSAADLQFMRTAMELAERGQFQVAPNPLVGCVIVSSEGRIIGDGWHAAFGEAHAEVEAYRSVSPADEPLLAESTWYVTLEPCNHLGKTPPCAALIERIQPKRVVIGIRDSNPAVTGGGVERLRATGIQVDVGCLADELAWQNRRFLWNADQKRPWVVLKWAESSDGFMDGRPLEERLPGAGGFPITAEAARPLTHTWRALEQGIAIGANTALVDMPLLNVRSIEAPSPRIVLLDPDGCIEPEHELIKRNGNLIHVVGPTKSQATAQTCNWEVKEGADALLERLYAQFHLSSLLVEGGATVLNDFLLQDAWNEIKCWTSPLATGGGLPAPSIPAHALPLPHGMKSTGKMGVDAWTNRLHPRHAFD